MTGGGRGEGSSCLWFWKGESATPWGGAQASSLYLALLTSQTASHSLTPGWLFWGRGCSGVIGGVSGCRRDWEVLLASESGAGCSGPQSCPGVASPGSQSVLGARVRSDDGIRISFPKKPGFIPRVRAAVETSESCRAFLRNNER